MKANELMIFDWIDIFPDYCKVLSIGKKGRIYTTTVSNYKVESDIGINITRSILEANDFDKIPKQDGNFYHRIIDGIIINIEPTIGNQWEVFITGHGRIETYIHYVHELQHILRVLGLKEFADNFKIKEGGQQ